jgi:hypothetical protein
VRIAYLDDSGIGSLDKDPFAIVAGVIVTADLQWRAIDGYLAAMRNEVFPDQPGAIFHAVDMWQGSRLFSGKRFRDKWPRRMLLLEICGLTKQFDLPVIYGQVDRAELNAKRPDLSPKDALVASLALCASQCTALVERYMRESAPAEVAMIVYENNDTTRTLIREVHNYHQDPDPSDLQAAESSTAANYLPARCVVDTAHFARKSDSSLLQLADAVAYAINRKLKNADDCDYLFDAINSQLIRRDGSWA